MAQFLAGIDLGTTTCRCLIFDLDGHEVASAQEELAAEYPRPAWAEMHPELWWRSVSAVVREAVERSQLPPERIIGVGVSGLMHAPVLLDAADQPLAPAMLWMDQRCAPQLAELRRAAEDEQVWLGTTHTAAKLRWLADMRPDLLERSRRLLLPKDFVRYRLTGVDGTDPSDAWGTGLYDRHRGAWLWRLVDATGLPRRLVPTVRPSGAPAGTVTPAAAAATGLAPGTPVAVGAGDAVCARLGMGPLEAGEVCLYLGTAAWIARARGRPGQEETTIVWGGATSTTGAALRWVRDLLFGMAHDGLPGGYEALVRAAERVDAGAEGLFCLPHLMGERGPLEDPLARGSLVGLTLRHGRPHVARSVLEGTTFQLRRVLDALTPPAGLEPKPSQGVACGGVAHSAFWTQLIADVTGMVLRVPETVEVGALGAAMLAAEAVGLSETGGARARMSRVGSAYEPDPERTRTYQGLYERYCALDDLLAPWFRDGRVMYHGALGAANRGIEL
jgi:xylulokinase